MRTEEERTMSEPLSKLCCRYIVLYNNGSSLFTNDSLLLLATFCEVSNAYRLKEYYFKHIMVNKINIFRLNFLSYWRTRNLRFANFNRCKQELSGRLKQKLQPRKRKKKQSPWYFISHLSIMPFALQFNFKFQTDQELGGNHRCTLLNWTDSNVWKYCNGKEFHFSREISIDAFWNHTKGNEILQ